MKIITTNIFHIKNKIIRILVNCLLSLAITLSLTALVLFTKIPNPNLILMTGLVVITVLLGFIPGIIPTIGLILYSFYFFSTNNNFVSFTNQNATKVGVAIVTAIICYAFVGFINYLYVKSSLSMMKENKKLKEISKTDALTKTKNRYSLRNDLSLFVNKDIQLMIFDVDNFKGINDTYGHQFGDKVLYDVSNITKNVFLKENVYRYGGDEFVILCNDLSLKEFKDDIKKLQNEIGTLKYENKNIQINLSIGYTYGIAEDINEIKDMIKFADKLMYKVKKSDKNGYLGQKFAL